MAASDVLAMSDEEFLKTIPDTPERVEEPEETVVVETSEVTAPEKAIVEEPIKTVVEKTVVKKAEKVEGTPNPHVEASGKESVKPKTNAETEVETQTETPPKEGEEDEESVEEKEGENTPDYESFYKQIMKPFKANGRTVELKTPEEAIQLMQMGANYTKKMQEFAPHRKLITMLTNNGLLDEDKLSYLIDLDKKNPEAIKKLVKDAGIDPMDIDVNAEHKVNPGNHRVSDEEVNFHSTLEDMKSSPEKIGTLQVINTSWDQASKDALWNNPEIITAIHDHRSSGIYDRIVAEVDRQRILGTIPVNVPFLQAYKTIGEDMTKANKFADIIAPPVVQKVVNTKVVPAVITRVETVKPVLKSGSKAAAAALTRSSAPVKKVPINPLAMDDEEFMKQFAGRL